VVWISDGSEFDSERYMLLPGSFTTITNLPRFGSTGLGGAGRSAANVRAVLRFGFFGELRTADVAEPTLLRPSAPWAETSMAKQAMNSRTEIVAVTFIDLSERLSHI
jgi:hypothetical protein